MSVSDEKENLTTREVAEILGVCQQRIQAKLRDGHFPNAFLCPCERTTLIPRKDLNRTDFLKRKRKVGR